MTDQTPYRLATTAGLETCLHCAARMSPIPHDHLRWLCSACGDPVIPGLDPSALDLETGRLLREAALLLSSRRVALRNAIRILMALAVAELVLFNVEHGAGLTLLLFLAFTVLPAVVIGSRSIAREKRLVKARGLIDEAWTRSAPLLPRVRVAPANLEAAALPASASLPDELSSAPSRPRANAKHE